MSVTVIIPFYNSEKYIAEAIDSCVIQKMVSQIVLVDDGSSDTSLKIAESYKKKIDYLLILKHDENRGRSAARNTGLSVVKTFFFAFLDADDFYLENHFETHLTLFKSNEFLDGTYSTVTCQYDDEFGKKLYPKETGIQSSVKSDELFEHLVLDKGQVSIIGCTFRSSTVLNVFLFDISLEIGEDTDFLWRLAAKRKLERVKNETTVIRRVHGSNSKYDQQKENKVKYDFYKKWLNSMDEYQLSSRMKKKIISSFAFYYSLQNTRLNLVPKWTQRFIQSIELLKRPDLWLSLFRN